MNKSTTLNNPRVMFNNISEESMKALLSIKEEMPKEYEKTITELLDEAVMQLKKAIIPDMYLSYSKSRFLKQVKVGKTSYKIIIANSKVYLKKQNCHEERISLKEFIKTNEYLPQAYPEKEKDIRLFNRSVKPGASEKVRM